MASAGYEKFRKVRRKWQYVSGWNEFVDEDHMVAREALLKWRLNVALESSPWLIICGRNEPGLNYVLDGADPMKN